MSHASRCRCRLPLFVLPLLVLPLVAGCDSPRASSGVAAHDWASAALQPQPARSSLHNFATIEGLAREAGADGGRQADDAPPAAHNATDPQTERKIIYHAHVDLVVESFGGLPEAVAALVERYGGYVAASSQTGSAGDSRRATWKIRVPVERFDEFLTAARGLGELVKSEIDSQDVSLEYYDVEARIRNKTAEERRLLELLESRPGELADVIAIERELSRVREELERMQARLRVLSDLTALTTVDLSVSEIRQYVPAETPTLTTRMRRAVEGSYEAIVASGENLLVALAAAVPWSPLVALVAALAYFGGRRLVRRATGRWRGATPLASAQASTS